MELIEQLKQIRQVCLAHFEELTQTKELLVFRINLSTYTIWGGNGDRDKDLLVLLTPEGWVERTVESETGLYQRGDGVCSSFELPTTEEGVAALANKYEENAALERLIKFINRIQDRYPESFTNA